MIANFKELFIAKTHDQWDKYVILRGLRYLLNVLLVAGTVGALALGSHTKSRGAHEAAKSTVGNRSASKGSR